MSKYQHKWYVQERTERIQKRREKIMCWNGHESHVEILFEICFEVFRGGKRKEEVISRREKIMSKDP